MEPTTGTASLVIDKDLPKTKEAKGTITLRTEGKSPINLSFLLTYHDLALEIKEGETVLFKASRQQFPNITFPSDRTRIIYMACVGIIFRGLTEMTPMLLGRSAGTTTFAEFSPGVLIITVSPMVEKEPEDFKKEYPVVFENAGAIDTVFLN